MGAPPARWLQAWVLVGLCLTAAASAEGAGPPAPPSAPSRTPSATAINASTATSSASTATSNASTASVPLSTEHVLQHVHQTVDWYHSLQNTEQLPQFTEDVVARDRLHQAALSCVRLAFTFGRAAAGVFAAEQPAAAAPATNSEADPQRALEEASARVTARITALQTQLNGLDREIARASVRERARLKAQRGELSAALDLAREVQSTLEELSKFQTSILAPRSGSAGGLLGQIEDLERAVPEARPSSASDSVAADASAPTSSPETASKAPAASGTAAHTNSGSGTAPAASSGTFRPESAGVLALASDWFELRSAQTQLAGMLGATDDLTKEIDGLRAPLVQQARTLVGTGTRGFDAQDLAALTAARHALQAAAAQFKQLSALLLPLGEQSIVLDSARSALTQWRTALHARSASVGRYLLSHVILLIGSIVAVLAVSAIARRATFRYLGDARRRGQLQTLRRILVGFALILVVVFELIPSVGSLATYVGFVTAGLAVALQNVILAIVAYFFLIGRYGVKVGDRITLAGVTGRVVEIGLLRLYVMEYAGPDMHATGRMVVLSNAVLFQPQALYKQIPGADYGWHTVSLTLTAGVDMQSAEQRLKAAADAVYERYRPAIEAQHAAMQQVLDFDSPLPRPEVRVYFVVNGLQFDVRYPVQVDSAARIDQEMTKVLREALAKNPQLPLAPSGEPTLKSSAS